MSNLPGLDPLASSLTTFLSFCNATQLMTPSVLWEMYKLAPRESSLQQVYNYLCTFYQTQFLLSATCQQLNLFRLELWTPQSYFVLITLLERVLLALMLSNHVLSVLSDLLMDCTYSVADHSNCCPILTYSFYTICAWLFWLFSDPAFLSWTGVCILNPIYRSTLVCTLYLCLNFYQNVLSTLVGPELISWMLEPST